MARFALTLTFTAVMLMIIGCGDKLNLEEDLNSMIQAERDFAAMSVEKGVKESFLEYLDSQSIIFRPHPINGREWMESVKATPGQLNWAPAYGDIASSGNIGFLTGPWEYNGKRNEDTLIFHGNYISIWARNAENEWKVILDTGISNPEPLARVADVQTDRSDRIGKVNRRNIDIMKTKDDLMELERRCSEYCLENGISRFYDKYSAANIRFFRDGQLPFTGIDEVGVYLLENPGELSWVPIEMFPAESGDFAYSYGSTAFKPENPQSSDTENGYYTRVWRIDDDGEWKIALDVISPVPPPPEQ